VTAQNTDGNYMLVLQDRVFYRGLLGNRMKARRLGGASIYLAPAGAFRLKLGGGDWTRRDIALVPPYQAHQVASDCGNVISVLIEPDRLEPGELPRLVAELEEAGRRSKLLQRLRAAAARLRQMAPDSGISTETFDRIVLGRALAARQIDPRIAVALEAFEEAALENPSLAADLARDIGLSASRFLHLFKEQTGVSFRNYRMWRRARSFLLHANHSGSLTDVALSLGYPDSSHFSHSIRKTYGLQPRAIRIGSQNLRVDRMPQSAGGQVTTGQCA